VNNNSTPVQKVNTGELGVNFGELCRQDARLQF